MKPAKFHVSQKLMNDVFPLMALDLKTALNHGKNTLKPSEIKDILLASVTAAIDHLYVQKNLSKN